MFASSIPTKISVPFASNASSSFVRTIPIPSQITTDPGAASFTDGFVPLNGTPIAAGGIPPDERDMNGILLAITQWNQWTNAGGPIPYDSVFQSAVGGYPAGAIIQSAIVPGKQWLSLVDNNLTNPDAMGAGWGTPIGQLPSGTPIGSFSSTVLPGCVLANGLTIGNAGSGGTTAPTGLASATAFFLFVTLWTQFPQSTCTTQFNGATVARGANASADWAAGRVITTPLMQGSALIGADANGSARLGGVPVVAGGTTTPGSIVGENTHTLTLAQIPTGITSENAAGTSISVASTVSNVDQGISGSTTGGGGSPVNSVTAESQLTSTGVISAGNIPSQSNNTSGGDHNNVSLGYLVYWNLSL
jgi:hypothetical protein